MKNKIMLLILVFILSLMVVTASEIRLTLVNQDPDPATAGDVVEIRLGVENLGGDPVNNLMLELIPEYPIEVVTGEDIIKDVGSLKPYQYEGDMKIVKFMFRINRDATAGSYDLKIYHYEKDSIAKIQKTFTIDVQNQESAEVIYIDQVELKPGEITPLRFTINNVGNAPLRDLTFKWENGDDIILPVGSDNTKYIKYIDVGEAANLEYKVIASTNADPDLYKLDLTLTYDDPLTNSEKTINSKAGIYVGGVTDFDVSYSGSSSDGETSFSISNIGSVSASSVTIKIPNQEGWRVSGTNSVIIGNLNEGDYTIASFNVQRMVARARNDSQTGIGGTFPRTVSSDINSPLILQILYTDSRGIRNTLEKEVTISSNSNTNMTSFANLRGLGARQPQSPITTIWTNSKWYIILFVVVLLTLYTRKRIKKGKLDDPGYGVANLVGIKRGKK